MHFHDFCCSNAEIIHQIALQEGLLEPPLPASPWGATIVEVGVETGETSRRLLELLPAHVRLIGVDPFSYNGTLSAELSKAERRQRDELQMRYDPAWLRQLAESVESMYAKVQPAGRAQLIRVGSPAAAEDPRIEAAGADLVFIDGDHSLTAVQRDIAAWLRVLQRSCKSAPVPRRCVLAGHDYTFMFPGVLTAVEDLVKDGSVLNLAANAVWWVSLPLEP
eukprot:gnl/TRDRNA2_/TRDRNA2_126985_c0_seq2.p2 gnl/TRDRNA2_/TRDRNA2_126985_c0~~gnl/TRDRNA2_/TRDRNA2_126985_c0_seq2.p2  ORF type:complete len:221 (+),score=53.07 gnl/TRDRNA2_/TRDRNA2_126985_c0_seq2:693-1355(+)